ncbi:hypothetical protein BDW62DRAFT_182130 [Aspergillus aurantiobrunneus]
MASSPDLEALRATQPLLDAEEYDSYSWVLLEDHPLRSYPTDADCHPDVSAFTSKFYAVVRRRWRERVLPLLCLLLMFFAIVHFLLQLPHIASYFLELVYTEDVPGFVQTPLTADRPFDHATTCVYDPPSQMEGTTYDAVESALSSGCIGVKVDLWQRHCELLVGSSPSGLDNRHTLRKVYLKSLQAHLDARNYASNDSTEEHDAKFDGPAPVGLFDENPLQPFTLFLDVQTPMRRAWPLLTAQLRTLNKSGYLSYRTAEQDVVTRPVTVVVSGRGCRRVSLMDNLSRAMKGLI